MLKRNFAIHSLISAALGLSAGALMLQAVEDSSIVYEIYTVIAVIACLLNIACGPDKSKK